ncbi:Rha family transcriptional regulator [Xanthobacter oligotrophicus]|uniref:Rha family transcriptional regulator n=1 Tax=Xanthobacter oligotrophicus TaxID=2607286 RepID=A0ABW6ZQF5_9HYPH
MSSREIAELLGNRHDDVRRSIQRLANRCVIELPPMAGVKNHLGQTVDKYLLDKRSSLIVVAELSPEFTARVVDRLQELEAQVAQPPAPQFAIPQTPPEALRLAAEQAERAIAAEGIEPQVGWPPTWPGSPPT